MKKRTHTLNITVTFERPCGQRHATRAVSDCIHGEFYPVAFKESDPQTFKIKKVSAKPSRRVFSIMSRERDLLAEAKADEAFWNDLGRPLGLTLVGWSYQSTASYTPDDPKIPGWDTIQVDRHRAIYRLLARLSAALRATDSGAGTGWQASDERIKRLMVQVGMPNSISLYQAFKQLEMEVRLAAAPPPPDAQAGGTPKDDQQEI